MYNLLLAVCLSVIVLTNAHARTPYSDHRKMYIHHGVDELGNFNWGNFLTCLETASFSSDKGPRKLNLSTSRLVTTTINNQSWVFSVREDNEIVILESVTIDTHHVYSERDKRNLFLKIVGNCKLDGKSTN